jgi:hypothetical protein
MTCARCDAPIEDDAPRIFGDCDSVHVCFECGSGWVAENIETPGISLRVYIGKATAAELRRHAKHLEDQRADEARAEAELAAKRERLAKEREARAEAARAHRVAYAAKVSRLVHERGSMNRSAVCDAAGVSSRTLARILSEARDRGWVVTSLGARGGVHPGPNPVPDDAALETV